MLSTYQNVFDLQNFALKQQVEYPIYLDQYIMYLDVKLMHYDNRWMEHAIDLFSSA